MCLGLPNILSIYTVSILQYCIQVIYIIVILTSLIVKMHRDRYTDGGPVWSPETEGAA